MYNENQISFWICWFVWNWLVDRWIDWIDGILWRRFTWKMYIWFLSWIIYSQMIIQLLLKFISCFYSSSMIYRVLNDITTKYVLMIDSSVEFTHNSNLPRMLALLQSNQVNVVSPMTEDAVSQTLSSNCFQVCFFSLSFH